jgi:hypothetical protein
VAARKPRRHAGEHDLIDALGLPGCPVCRLAGEAVDAFLASVCYEQVNDLDLRAELREVGGFCRPHAYRFLRQRHGQLASAIISRDVLATAARRIEQRGTARSRSARGGSLLGGLLGSRPARRARDGEARGCPACRVLAEAEQRHLGTLRKRLADPAVQARYRSADGLCLPHLDRAFERDDTAARFLAEVAVATLGTLVDELDEYIRKHDYRFRPTVWEGGEDVPERAVGRAVGRPEVDP